MLSDSDDEIFTRLLLRFFLLYFSFSLHFFIYIHVHETRVVWKGREQTIGCEWTTTSIVVMLFVF
jgi:hypothetical protein